MIKSNGEYIFFAFSATDVAADAAEAEKSHKLKIIIGVVVATVGLVLIIIVIACFVQRRRQQNASHHVTNVKKTTSGKNKKLTKQDIQQSFKGVKRVSQKSDLLICFEHSTISIKWTQCTGADLDYVTYGL